jgi:hypothetical protein
MTKAMLLNVSSIEGYDEPSFLIVPQTKGFKDLVVKLRKIVKDNNLSTVTVDYQAEAYMSSRSFVEAKKTWLPAIDAADSGSGPEIEVTPRHVKGLSEQSDKIQRDERYDSPTLVVGESSWYFDIQTRDSDAYVSSCAVYFPEED